METKKGSRLDYSAFRKDKVFVSGSRKANGYLKASSTLAERPAQVTKAPPKPGCWRKMCRP